jgi:hypothetical protein
VETRALLVEIARRAAWPPALVFAVHVVASLVFHAYARLPSLDLAMHPLGGCAIACCFARTLELLARDHAAARLDARVQALLVFALTATAAVVWEFAEFVADRTAGTGAQVGLEDTLLDLALGMLGGALYLAARSRARRTRDRGLAHRAGGAAS